MHLGGHYAHRRNVEHLIERRHHKQFRAGAAIRPVDGRDGLGPYLVLQLQRMIELLPSRLDVGQLAVGRDTRIDVVAERLAHRRLHRL